ncbi:penicillin-binding transpeptidase domain-containing protein [Humidesulfovibrio sp.]
MKRTLLCLLALLLFPALCPAADITRPDLAPLFDERGFDGCFVVQRGTDTIRLNPERAAMRFRPASTFKVVNALAALESGIAPDPGYLIPWDGVTREVSAWNADLTLTQAFRASAVWWFVELGKRNGRERLGAAMRALSYGNADASGSDRFWLDGPLRISADEQLRVMDGLARGSAPFSARSQRLLRHMMLLDQGVGQGVHAGGAWALYGKTGAALLGGGAGAGDAPVGWLVGYVLRGGQAYPFALNLSPGPGSGNGMAELMPARMALVRKLLERLDILPGT